MNQALELIIKILLTYIYLARKVNLIRLLFYVELVYYNTVYIFDSGFSFKILLKYYLTIYFIKDDFSEREDIYVKVKLKVLAAR